MKVVSRRQFIVDAGALLAVSAALPLGLPGIASGAEGLALAPATLDGLDFLDQASFASALRSIFHVRTTAHRSVSMRLIGVVDMAPKPASGAVAGECFSLLFRAPRRVALTQGTYAFSHASLGEFGLFIVPMGSDRKGAHFEAVINRQHA